MLHKTIPFNKPFMTGKELWYISQAHHNGQLSGDGPFTKKCHEWLKQQTGCGIALLTQSCTAALEMAAILADIQPGDEVIMPSFTFVSTANAFVLRGGVPVFVDIREDTLNIDERLIEAAITTRTKAIVPVHYAGIACEMDSITEIASRHNLLVIEDAAQGLMSAYKGRALGSIGHLGTFSFHETKNITSGEGGALLVNDERFIERAEIIREKGTNRSRFFRGQVDKYTWVDIGSSYLPGELIAAFLYAQFESAKEITVKRQLLRNMYLSKLRPLEDASNIKLPLNFCDKDSNGHLAYILTRDSRDRDQLLRYLKGRGINAVFHYVPLHSSPAGLRYGRTGSSMAATNDISLRLVRLPLYYDMNEELIDEVVHALYSFYGMNY